MNRDFQERWDQIVAETAEAFDRLSKSIAEIVEPLSLHLGALYEDWQRDQLLDSLLKYRVPRGIAEFIADHWPASWLPEVDFEGNEK